MSKQFVNISHVHVIIQGMHLALCQPYVHIQAG